MEKNLLLLLFFLIMSCNNTGQKKEFRIATYTYSTNNRLQNLEPLARYLSEKTGLDFTAVSYPTVQDLLYAIKNDSVDFAMMNTSGYLILQRNNAGIVTPLMNLDIGNNSSTNYAGCIITLKESGFKTIEDLKINNVKLSLALVMPSSTSGNLVPRLLFNSHAIADAEAAFKVSYSGTHKNVVEDVLNGKADIGGCSCAVVDSARKNLNFDEKAIVIDSFSDIPLGPIVHNSKLEKKVTKQVAGLLGNLHLAKPDVFSYFCNGWTEFKEAVKFKTVTDKDYDALRKMFGSNTGLWK